MAPKSDLLQGTLDLLILKTLNAGPMHGWGISLSIQQVSRDVLQVNQGSLYPALHRLEQQGLIAAAVGQLREQPAGEVLRADQAPAASSWPRRPGTGNGCCAAPVARGARRAD